MATSEILAEAVTAWLLDTTNPAPDRTMGAMCPLAWTKIMIAFGASELYTTLGEKLELLNTTAQRCQKRKATAKERAGIVAHHMGVC